MQFCWAHLIRDVKFLVTLPDATTRRFGEKLLATIKHLFRLWHRRDQLPAERWQREAERAKRAVLQVARRPPCRSEAQNIAQRFRRHAEHYFRFLETPGVEPTNNAIEQRFRFVVIDRKITQGDSRRGRPPLVRTHLDRAGHLRPAGPLGVRLPLSLDRRSLHKPTITIPTADSAVNGDLFPLAPKL